MQTPLDQDDESQLAGRCPFCAAEVPPGATKCPDCGHQVNRGYVFALRHPIWLRAMIWLILIMVFGSLLLWLLDVLQRGIGPGR